MPPSHMDFIRARITHRLNRGPFDVAQDHGTHIAYTVNGRTYEITVKELDE